MVRNFKTVRPSEYFCEKSNLKTVNGLEKRFSLFCLFAANHVFFFISFVVWPFAC